MAPSEGKWVRLAGQSFDLQEVAAAFEDPPNVRFMNDPAAEWWISSTLFDSLNTPDEVRAVAKDLVATLSGCASLLWSNHRPISADDVVFMENPATGRPTQFVVVPAAESRARAGRLTVTVGGVMQELPHPQLDWLREAMKDPDVAGALRIYGRAEPSWGDLYHLIELVEAQISQKVNAAGYISRNERQRFTHTANSRLAVGDQARHGDNRSAPANPMTLEEARHLGRTVLLAFLESRRSGSDEGAAT